MENNRAWIRKQMEDGCTVYDCGPAPGRASFPLADESLLQDGTRGAAELPELHSGLVWWRVAMMLRIKRVENAYTATVTPSHGDDVRWETSGPTSLGALIDALELGFHQQDIGHVFDEADPDWLQRPLREGES